MRCMKWRFDRTSLYWAALLFVLLVLLATAGAGMGWLRGFFGDVLAVIWLYFVFKTFIHARATVLAGAAFAMGVLLELGQYLVAYHHIHIPGRVLRIVLGSTADIWDVLAYALGAMAVLAMEAMRRRGFGKIVAD